VVKLVPLLVSFSHISVDCGQKSHQICVGICWHGLITSSKAIHLLRRWFLAFALVLISADLYVPGRNTSVPAQAGCVPWNKLTFFLANNFACVRRVRKVESLPALFLNKTVIVTLLEDQQQDCESSSHVQVSVKIKFASLFLKCVNTDQYMVEIASPAWH